MDAQPIEDLADGDRCRLPTGEVGYITDRVDHPGWRKVHVEVHGTRYPVHLVDFGIRVERVPQGSRP